MNPLVLAEPERPFWGFAELMLAAAIFLAALGTVIGAASRYLHAPPDSGLWSVLEEAAAYAILFVALKIMFARFGRGLLDSLGWSKPGPFSPMSLAAIGVCLSLAVAVLERVLLTPDVDTPFDKLLDDPASRVAVALFGITLAPMVEELLFRGFLQPVLVSAMGVFPGILVTSLLFGALHLTQNAFIWQSGVLIMLVGFVLGTIRHLTGSTRASTIVHIAYNSLPFMALLVEGNPLARK
jgi:membrane protease YdiL (CAAX protease family)